MLTIVILVLSRNKQEFFVSVMFVGVFAGPLQSASRVLMMNLLNPEDLGKGFGLFTFSARSTAFIGPLLVGTLTYFVSQKYAILAVIPLFYIGYYLFKKLETS
jgi:UMF1 family MFS transporter